jgi:hypothetical protein
VYTWQFNTADDELAAMLLPIEAQSALTSFMDALVFNPTSMPGTPMNLWADKSGSWPSATA